MPVVPVRPPEISRSRVDPSTKSNRGYLLFLQPRNHGVLSSTTTSRFSAARSRDSGSSRYPSAPCARSPLSAVSIPPQLSRWGFRELSNLLILYSSANGLIISHRVFVVPVTPDAASKAAEKIASGPRSSIRRQRPARSQPLSVENIRRRIQGMAADASQDRYDVWENPTREQRPSPRRDEEPPAAPRPRFNEDRMRLRDTLSFERQSPPNMEIDGPLMPPAPEPREYPSADVRRREIQRLLEVRRDLRRIARRRPAPTPPYTDTDIALMARMRTESPRPSSVAPTRSPRLTPGQVEMATSALGARPATGQGLATREQRRLARSPPLLRLSFQDTEALAAQETPADGPSTAQDPPSAADVSLKILSVEHASALVEAAAN